MTTSFEKKLSEYKSKKIHYRSGRERQELETESLPSRRRSPQISTSRHSKERLQNLLERLSKSRGDTKHQAGKLDFDHYSKGDPK